MLTSLFFTLFLLSAGWQCILWPSQLFSFWEPLRQCSLFNG